MHPSDEMGPDGWVKWRDFQDALDVLDEALKREWSVSGQQALLRLVQGITGGFTQRRWHRNTDAVNDLMVLGDQGWPVSKAVARVAGHIATEHTVLARKLYDKAIKLEREARSAAVIADRAYAEVAAFLAYAKDLDPTVLEDSYDNSVAGGDG